MKRFILGDIHGMKDYLLDVLNKSGFDYENDLLIQVGDIVDRGPDPFGCMHELMRIKNKVLILGNHDDSFINFIKTGEDMLGTFHSNGSRITIQAWNKLSLHDRAIYKVNILDQMIPYHITSDNIMITHGGFPTDELLERWHPSAFAWDRDLVQKAMSCSKGQTIKTLYDFKKAFIGHTPTIYWETTLPIFSGGIWNVDTGSGKTGPLTIMDMDTEEYWQSDHNFLSNNPGYAIIKKEKNSTGEGSKEESPKIDKEAA